VVLPAGLLVIVSPRSVERCTETLAATRLEVATVGGSTDGAAGLNPTAISRSPPPSAPRSLSLFGASASG